MKRDDIIRMAREADVIDFRDEDDDEHVVELVNFLSRITSAAESAEREACAKVVDGNIAASTPGSRLNDILMSNAAAIRARGQA